MANTSGVPLCDIRAQYQQLETEIQESVLNVLSSGQVVLGPEVAALEEEVARYCGAGHGIGCSSGTDAILLALYALGIGAGDEVILPAFTFFATAGSVIRTGATPVFVDIDLDTYNMDPADVERKITSRTRAILAVHLYGQTADMEPLWQIAERHDIDIIEDAAQAIGAEYQDKRTGTLGAMACFSFYPSKNLGAMGDAGIVVTSDPELANLMTALRIHGMETKYYHKYLGWNARIDAVQAAILRVKLRKLEEWTTQRQQAAERYTTMIEEYGLSEAMTPPVVESNRRHVFNQYVIKADNGRRDELMAHLKQHNIGCDIYYPISLHLQECLTYLGYREGDLPNSEQAGQYVLALPMYPHLQAEQQQQVIETCSEFFRGRGRRAA